MSQNFKHYTYDPVTQKYSRKKSKNLYPGRGGANCKVKLLMVDQSKPERRRLLESIVDDKPQLENNLKLGRDLNQISKRQKNAKYLGSKVPGSQGLPLMGVLNNFTHDPQTQLNYHKYKDYKYQQEQDLKEFNDLEEVVTAKSGGLSLEPAPYSYSNSPQKSNLSHGKRQNMYANGPRYTMERNSNEKKYEDFFKNKKKVKMGKIIFSLNLRIWRSDQMEKLLRETQTNLE